MAEINITPFTDVLLVLLIIFVILAAVATPPGFEKQLPKSSPPSARNLPPPVVVNVLVNEKGQILIDGTTANQQSVYYVMYQAVHRKPGKAVQITADTKAPYGIIIRILDAAKEANAQDVSFVTS